MRLALIGPPQSGKTTLFSAITGQPVEASAYGQEQLAVVHVPDHRVHWLEKLESSKKITRATLEFVDVPGFALSTAEGRDAFLKHVPAMRDSDGLVAVVGGFTSASVPAYKDRVDPLADLAELRDELLFGDLEQVTARLERLEKQIGKPTPDREARKRQYDLLGRCKEALENEQPISAVIKNEEEAKLVRSFAFLTLKPLVAVVNVGEDHAADPPAFESDVANVCLGLCAEMEAEIAQLDEADRPAFMADLGLTEPAQNRMIRACYKGLGLISFLTASDMESRAWTIRAGDTAVEAAGKVHSDIARGFIRAETVAYDDLVAAGDMKAAKAAGKVRLEGKDYVVKDGDLILFRFNV